MARLELETQIAHWTYGREVRNGYERRQSESGIEHFVTRFASVTEAGRRVVLFQAGAVVHVDDPLGPGRRRGMTDDDMRQRDRYLLTLCRNIGIPVVWNLAGGYQRDELGGISKVLSLHRATMEECAQCFVVAGSPETTVPQAVAAAI